MTTFDSATGPCGSKKAGLTTKRRQAGTTLVEILVVIVIFLIGILAVVQIFPRGFRLLLTSRNNSVATALGRDEVERLKSHPDMLPEAVLAVRYLDNTTIEVNNTINPLSLTADGDGISAGGVLWRGGTAVKNEWALSSGPNIARRIIGEGQRVPAPRRTDFTNSLGLDTTDKTVMASYGGLMVLEHGPVDGNAPLVVYANDLTRSVGEPLETSDRDTIAVDTYTADGLTDRGDLTGRLAVSPVVSAPYEYFVVNPGRNDASILLPATYNLERKYRIRMSAYVGGGTGYSRVDYVSLCIRVPKVPGTKPGYAFVRVFLNDILANTPGAKPGGTDLGSVELDTIRVAPLYDQRQGSGKDWTSPATLESSDPAYNPNDYTPINPFEVKVTDPNLGTLLISPAARQGVVNRPGGVSEPLVAKADYDVLDWRVIREDFRITGSQTVTLALQSLKVGTQSGPDGLKNGGIWPGTNALDPSPSPTDNVAIMDMNTGLLVVESAGSVPYVAVDKSRGSVTFLGDKVHLAAPNGAVEVPIANRTFRIMYRARNEWAVQLLKSASQYTAVNSFDVGAGQYLVGNGSGGTSTTRVYFPQSDANRKVTIDSITYVRSDNTIRTLEGQDFVTKAGSLPTLAYIDLLEVDPYAANITTSLNSATAPERAQAVRGVKGASVAVRVLWNPESFSLVSDLGTNFSRAEVWARSWRPSMTETFLREEETR